MKPGGATTGRNPADQPSSVADWHGVVCGVWVDVFLGCQPLLLVATLLETHSAMQ